MEFRVLGPLEVLGDDGEPLPLGGRRPRAVSRSCSSTATRRSRPRG